MDAGHITPGVIDDRPIQEISGNEVIGFERAHFFAGIAGWEVALNLAGWRGRCWTGSCPCQPLSSAGQRKGHADERHLWPAFYRLIAECAPPVVFGEQVASKDGREWLAGVRLDLESLGYACGAADLPAAGVAAPHRRQRIWWVADSLGDEQPGQEPCGRQARRVGGQFEPLPWRDGWETALSLLRIVDDGIPRLVAATDAARNAIVPQVAAEFIRAYREIA